MDNFDNFDNGVTLGKNQDQTVPQLSLFWWTINNQHWKMRSEKHNETHSTGQKKLYKTLLSQTGAEWIWMPWGIKQWKSVQIT